ncbi:MAG: glycosyltransferase family 25 protein [bacterium]
MKDFFSHFEAIYCINLDRRTDRWEVAQKEFKKAGILDRVIRFSAFETPKKGAAGCLLSHRTIVQIAKERGWENVLVFEDDIEFIDIDFPVNFLELPAKWNLFYL